LLLTSRIPPQIEKRDLPEQIFLLIVSVKGDGRGWGGSEVIPPTLVSTSRILLSHLGSLLY
jgi:hypothetical protein